MPHVERVSFMKIDKNVITPFSAADGEMTMDDLNNLAANALSDGAGAAQEDNSDDNAVQGDDSTPDNSTPEGEQPSEEEVNKRTAQDKQNYAFAQQRHEITELTELLKTMADANGIKYDSKADLVAKLKDKALVEKATQQNIPVELLREVEQLRADSNQWKKYQHEQAAMAGFNRVAAEFGLDQKGLEAFAVELDQAGKNPFTSAVDVVSEYKARHLDEIVARKVQAAVEAALKGDATVSSKSSTPPSTQGVGSASEGNESISTVAQLTALYNGR